MRLIFDIETNGLLPDMDRIHCICGHDLVSGKTFSAGPDKIDLAVEYLQKADEVIAHNGITFDIPAIQKIYPDFKPKKVTDTLVLSRLIYSEMMDYDYKNHKVKIDVRDLIPGGHTLKSWGTRLNFPKGDYGDNAEEGVDIWAEFNQEMLEYCEQDVRVTVKLYKKLMAANYSEQAIELEHWVANKMFEQETYGVLFDRDAAIDFEADLVSKRQQILDDLRTKFKGEQLTMSTPEYYTWAKGDVTIKETTKKKVEDKIRAWRKETDDKTTYKNLFKLIENGPLRTKKILFNPSSREHIAEALIQRYNWEPKEFTDTGRPKVDESVLEDLPYPEAKQFNDYLLIAKRLGQLSTGTQAWLGHAKEDSRIHGRVIHNGAVTGRATHSSPNLGQVPSLKKGHANPLVTEFGKRCRSLFTVPEGYKLIGSDADGLELRCLASYMQPYDDGQYMKAVTEGSKEDGTDIHTLNQHAAGLPTRDDAKKFIYTWLYGGGNYKIGLTVGVTEEEAEELLMDPKAASSAEWYFNNMKKEDLKKGRKPKSYDKIDYARYIKGAQLKEQFLSGNPAIAELRDTVTEAAKERGFLVGLDGRRLHVRSPHSALNTLLQSAGALICKQWMWEIDKLLVKEGIREHANQVLWVHDEVQIEVKEENAERVAAICEEAMLRVGDHFPRFKCPLIANADIGINWMETH